jgi:hypothetical protein
MARKTRAKESITRKTTITTTTDDVRNKDEEVFDASAKHDTDDGTEPSRNNKKKTDEDDANKITNQVDSKEIQPAVVLDKDNDTTTTKNELTQWIPGYTAPLRLETSSTTTTTKAVGLASRIQMLVSSKHSLTTATKPSSSLQQRHFKTGKLTRDAIQQRKKHCHITAGSSWFDMRPTPMSKQLAHDLQVLKSRAVIDPKRFYKKTETPHNDKHPTMPLLQMGTVVAGPMEGSTQRLTKSQTRATLADQILAHESKYVMNKYKSMQQEKQIQYNKNHHTKRRNHSNKRKRN